MDIYCTVEERYIQAVEELRYGETAKALRLFNDLLAVDSSYGRVYFQIGIINFYYIKDYQAAGYYFTKCLETEPDFPDVYPEFLKLLVFLDMEKKALQIASDALSIQGANKFEIFRQLGLLEEKHFRWSKAASFYKKSLTSAFNKEDLETAREDIERVNIKGTSKNKVTYEVL